MAHGATRQMVQEGNRVQCPFCGAQIGVRCKILHGKRKGDTAETPHMARLDRARGLEYRTIVKDAARPP